jgi:hypothetical protein
VKNAAGPEGGGGIPGLTWENNLDIDPDFIDPDEGDFRISYAAVDTIADSGSDALVPPDVDDLDADGLTDGSNGHPAEPTPLDFDSRPRFRSAMGAIGVGMGAFELQGRCDGDCAEYDGSIDVADLLTQWGAAGVCDFNHDRNVNITDLLVVLAAWGSCTAGSQPILRTVSECMAQYTKPEEQYACICGGA